MKAKERLLASADMECQQFFVKNNHILENAYLELLNQKPEEAGKLFLRIKENDIRAHWGVFLAMLVQGKLDGYPSYFELRNFFEIDFNLFINHGLGDYVENILKYLDFLCAINPEVYKFTG